MVAGLLIFFSKENQKSRGRGGPQVVIVGWDSLGTLGKPTGQWEDSCGSRGFPWAGPHTLLGVSVTGSQGMHVCFKVALIGC